MDKKKGVNFALVIIAFILGTALFKHFDFKTVSFKKPALDIVYLITFVITIYVIVKDYKKRPENKNDL